jgi:hypothetical protein
LKLVRTRRVAAHSGEEIRRYPLYKEPQHALRGSAIFGLQALFRMIVRFDPTSKRRRWSLKARFTTRGNVRKRTNSKGVSKA